MILKELKEYLGERRENSAETSLRNPFAKDKARIIHSSAFRRLQSKKQILTIGTTDFNRTRLTHSLETAQIASGILEILSGKLSESDKKYLPSPFLLDAICLGHDIGHPPFGHSGEKVLNDIMSKYDGHFEGNAQTLRIVAHLGEYSQKFGYNLTRGVLLGIIKYPQFISSKISISTQETPVPKYLFEEEKDIVEWVIKPFYKEDKEQYYKTTIPTIYTSIMDTADDIAYGVHDLEDAIILKLIDRDVWQKEIVNNIGNCPIPKYSWNKITNSLFSSETFKVKKIISILVNYLITSTYLHKKKLFHSNLLDYGVMLETHAEYLLRLLKNFVAKNVIYCRENLILEYKTKHIIENIFHAIESNPLKFLPHTYKKIYTDIKSDKIYFKKRVIADYVSGMTDTYIDKLYKYYFTPGTGSIFERI